MDVTNASMVKKVWPIISNSEAIKINQDFSGHPGKLVQQSNRTLPLQFVHALPCDGGDAQNGVWHVSPDTKRGPTVFSINHKSGGCAASVNDVIEIRPCNSSDGCQRFTQNASDNGALQVILVLLLLLVLSLVGMLVLLLLLVLQLLVLLLLVLMLPSSICSCRGARTTRARRTAAWTSRARAGPPCNSPAAITRQTTGSPSMKSRARGSIRAPSRPTRSAACR